MDAASMGDTRVPDVKVPGVTLADGTRVRDARLTGDTRARGAKAPDALVVRLRLWLHRPKRWPSTLIVFSHFLLRDLTRLSAVCCGSC
jgi:hypothetical protein